MVNKLLQFHFPEETQFLPYSPADIHIIWPGADAGCWQWAGGRLIQQVLHQNGFGLCLLQFDVQRPACIEVEVLKGCAYLQLTLQGNAMSYVKGLSNCGSLFELIEGSYTLLYLPQARHKFWVHKGTYCYVYMPIGTDMLRHFSETFVHLKPLFQSMQTGHTAGLVPERLRITPALHALLAGLLKSPAQPSNRYLQTTEAVTGILRLYNGQLQQKQQPGYASGPADYATELRLYIADHIFDTGALRLSNLCQFFNLEMRSLERYFSWFTPLAPTVYISRQKLQIALYLLQDTSWDIKEIAYQLGYQHPQNFSKQFRKYFGFYPVAGRHYFEPDA